MGFSPPHVVRNATELSAISRERTTFFVVLGVQRMRVRMGFALLTLPPFILIR